MNFDLDELERALQQGIRDVCGRLFPIERVRTLEDERGGIDRSLWRDLAQAGVFSLRLPEPDGIGVGMAQAVLVFEEIGRTLVPGPVISTHLAAAMIEGAASGRRVIGMIERERAPHIIGHLDATDVVVIADEEGLWTVEAAALSARRLARPLDPLTPMHLIESLPRGDPLAPADVLARWRLEGAALVAAMQLGIASAVVERAVDYAKHRQQFGRLIGSFQAVKHICADMLVRAEVARAAVYAAGVMLDDPAVGDAPRAVAGARLLAAEAALANCKANIQVHGGMGYTWEVDAHLYLKRAALLATRFGRGEEWAEEVAACLA